MKVAPKVILLLNDGAGLATAISTALQPNPDASLQKQEESLELPLERYGIRDSRVSGQFIHFLNANGDYEVSILLLQRYESPVLACALNEVLAKLAGDDSPAMPTLIVPFLIPASKLKLENKYSVENNKVSIYGVKIGQVTDVTQALSSKLQHPPPSLRIYHEELSCFLHLVNTMKLPAYVLMGQSTQHLSSKISKEDTEVIYEIGEHLESTSGLSFSRERMILNLSKPSIDNKEPWRALYG